jgi:arylsulfatase A-like enzyme
VSNVSELTSRPVLLVGLLGLVAVFLVAAILQPFDRTENSGRTENPGPPNRPNVLIFITDDQRPESMEAMPKTSRYFVNEGRWYPNAFATTPVCCPSRASIFTGRFVHNHDVKKFTPYELDQATTLQAILRASGYRTGFFGKYLNAWSLSDVPPHFDDWAFFPQSSREAYFGLGWRAGEGITDVERYSTDYLGDRALRFLKQGTRENPESPWLMFISTPAAHLPFSPEGEFRDEPVGTWEGNDAVFEQDLSDKPEAIQRPVKGKCSFTCGRRVRELQNRTLMSVDSMVDRVMGELTELGQADNTIAFFVSDNGMMWGEHGVRNKRWPYTESVQVPLGVRWPARLEPGIDERLVATVDIVPTVLDATGGAPDRLSEVDGRSLLEDQWERDEMLLEHWPSTTVPGYGSIRTENYQYVEYYARNMRRVTFREYYDLSADPWQLENLLARPNQAGSPNDATLRDLSLRLKRLRRCEGQTCP